MQHGHQKLCEIIVLQDIHARARVTRGEKLQRLVKQTRRWNVAQQRLALIHGVQSMRFDFKIQFGNETQDTQHAHGVFTKTGCGVANDAQHVIAQIGHTTVVIKHHLTFDIVVQRVNRHVAPFGIRFNPTIDIVAQHATMLIGVHVIGVVTSKCRDFNQIAFVHHVDNPKTPPNDARAAKQLEDLFWARIGCDIEVFGNVSEHQITYRATHHIRIKTCISQCLCDRTR